MGIKFDLVFYPPLRRRRVGGGVNWGSGTGDWGRIQVGWGSKSACETPAIPGRDLLNSFSFGGTCYEAPVNPDRIYILMPSFERAALHLIYKQKITPLQGSSHHCQLTQGDGRSATSALGFKMCAFQALLICLSLQYVNF